MHEFHLLADLETLSLRAAEIFIEISRCCIISKKGFVVAVSGGSTPKRLYAILSSDQHSNKIDWEHLHFFWVDERFVPPFHEDSNYRLLRDNLLSKISIPQENIHPINTDLSSPEASAERYEDEIRKFFQLPAGLFPEFDLILLGIGEDGHTASLFPGSEVLGETEQLVTAVMDKKHEHYRITLTLPVINEAGKVIFLVSGKNKAGIVKKVLEEKDRSLPASLVKPKKGDLIFLIDKEAGSSLESE